MKRAALPSAATLLLLAIVGLPAAAQAQTRAPEQPYCARSRGHDIGYTVCGFATLEACRQELLGMGGDCYPNPYYKPPEQRPREGRPRRRER